MEKGLVFAIFAAISFAANAVFIRKIASQTGESFTGAVISVFVGIPFFAVAVFVSGEEWSKLWSVSGQAIALLVGSGIIHFAAGRFLAYGSIRLIGANRASALLMTSPFYTLIFAAIFLHETITVYLILGVLCIAGGAALASIERKSVAGKKQGVIPGTEVKGILMALGAAFCWGISAILIKPAIEETGSPLTAAFIAYAAASVVMAFTFFSRKNRQQLIHLPVFSALIPLVVSAAIVALGQLFRYTALNYSPASMVQALLGTNILFIVLFSFLLNRKIEVFAPRVIVGMIATVIGTFLIFY